MYIPRHFQETDKDKIVDFIEANAFGQLVSITNGKITSTHMPFLLSDDNTKLLGHLALQNPQHEGLDGQEVLITLEGPHDYISPSWYTKPGVPTWNYQAVHIYGNCKVFSESEKLKSIVNSLTGKYEAGFESPWQPDYNPAMLKAIIGVEILISDIQCKFKLSQNRTTEERQQVI